MERQNARGWGYNAYILDMDGTLYYKRPMQIQMAMQLLGWYLPRFYRMKELFLLKAYREFREDETLTSREGFEEEIRMQLSVRFRISEARVDALIRDWMLERPLDILRRCADQNLTGLVSRLREQGKKVYIYSDYPAVDKTAALGLNVDGIYWPDDIRIRVMKPEPDGLRFILQENGLKSDECLFIGDRAEKDGKCACAVGMEFLILRRTPGGRNRQYKELFG